MYARYIRGVPYGYSTYCLVSRALSPSKLRRKRETEAKRYGFRRPLLHHYLTGVVILPAAVINGLPILAEELAALLDSVCLRRGEDCGGLKDMFDPRYLVSFVGHTFTK